MILLDTNVVSEVMRPAPRREVVEWLDSRNAANLFLSTITIAEIRFGLCALPEGRRRRALEEKFELFLARAFSDRIVPFDVVSAHLYGELMGHRKRIGRPMSIPDGQIAAIARANRFSVATGNVSDFDHCSLDVVNPFD